MPEDLSRSAEWSEPSAKANLAVEIEPGVSISASAQVPASQAGLLVPLMALGAVVAAPSVTLWVCLRAGGPWWVGLSLGVVEVIGCLVITLRIKN